MKRITKVIGATALVIALASCLAAGYYLVGPAMKVRTDRADEALTLDSKARASAAKALDETAALPNQWQNLSFDETAELARIIVDLEANRENRVDNYRDSAAATVAKDIGSVDKVLVKAEKDLQSANKKLLIAHKIYLPADKDDAIDSALRNNIAMSRSVKTARSALKELKSDNYIWCHLAAVVKSDGEVLAALVRADTALKAGDYIALQEATAAANASLTYSTDWLTLGESELVNLALYPKDAVQLVEFVSKGMETTQSFEQAVMFMFGSRADAAALKLSTEKAGTQLSALQKMADTQQLGRGYKAWFLAVAKRRL